MNFSHSPVMLAQCIEALDIKQNGTYVDCTCGGGGHSEKIAEKLCGGRLVDIDKDQEAIAATKERLAKFDFITYVNSDFKQIDGILDQLDIEKTDGFLIDLGVSSHQIDDEERGFSYMHPDALLDMRMDRRQSLSAADVVNNYPVAKLTEILRDFGEEQFAYKIACNIAAQRETKQFETCGELVAVVDRSIPFKAQKQGSHNAKKTFQALRIEVNGELEGLKDSLSSMLKRLNKGGRMAVLTFHSLEDRIVKQLFALEATDCLCDKSIPICVCGHKASIKNVTKKPIEADAEEQQQNPRSKSAKLRIAEKL